MLKRLIISAAVEGLNSEMQKPQITFDHCLNRLQKKYPCHVCRDICPANAILYNKKLVIDPDKCIGCYLCSGACPTSCISTHPSFIKTNETAETLVISCEVGENQLKLPCLASLPWTSYAYLSYQSPVCLDTTRCHDCQVPAKASIDAIKERLKIFWGDEYEQKILWNSTTVTKALSRRDFFSMFVKPLKNAKVSIDVTSNTEGRTSGRIFRHLLIGALDPTKTHGWLTPSIEEGCRGCYVCERVCSSKAIKVAEDIVYITPLDCNSCGLCAKVCPTGTITGLTTRQLTKENATLAFPIHSNNCQGCGAKMSPKNEKDRCVVCQRKQ